MPKIAIIHFLPLEYYPPVTNFLNIISSEPEAIVRVYSSHNNKKRKVYSNTSIKIARFKSSKSSQNGVIRLLLYIWFNLGVFIKLLVFRPDRILYYETYSAIPALLYSLIFPTTGIFIHFHEYFDKTWYKNGMRLLRIYHLLEVKYLFPYAAWISQTNERRLAMFQSDYPQTNSENMFVVPNYPPAFWNKSKTLQIPGSIIKVVYIGSISLEKTYIREFCEWVIRLKGKVNFDIYAYNLSNDARQYLSSLGNKNIDFVEGGIEYDQIPNLLRQYDVGVILYKGTSNNFKFNATNKLFEYLVCNLDVWYPQQMEGCYQYDNSAGFPKVIRLDFDFLDQYDTDALIYKSGSIRQPMRYSAEDAFKPLINRLTKSLKEY